MKKAKYITVILSAMIIIFNIGQKGAMATETSASGDHQIINMLADNGETFENRRDRIVSQLNAIYNDVPSMAIAEKPSFSAPYSAGKLADAYLENALTALNFGRYLSGLPSVTMKQEYNNYAQHAAVLLSAAKELSHAPAKPADMNEDFFNLASKGASGNIAVNDEGNGGFMSLASMVMKGWFGDSDSNNASHVGHRQNALNPNLGPVGFGQAFALPSYYTMYVWDRSATAPDYEAIGYPSGSAFPTSVFSVSDNWSVMLNPKYYQTPDINTIVVTVEGGGKVSKLSKDTKNVSGTGVWGEYFTIDYTAGQPSCIIFRPDSPVLAATLMYYGTYNITITGIKTIEGKEASLSYKTTFFEWDSKTNSVKPVIQPRQQEDIGSPASNVSIIFTVGNKEYTVNNEKKASEAPPYIAKDGRVMVPIRFVAEAFGATVTWMGEERTSIIEFNGKTMNIEVGRELPGGLGTAVLSDNRLFVPVRYVAEQLGAQVDWNGESLTVHITR